MIVFPSPLKPGDTIGLIAPSFPIKEEELKDCIALLEAMGYHVKVGGELAKLSNFHNYLAGEAKKRADDINAMFADPEVNAIFCVRGGYGSSQTMEFLDFDVIRANPKIFVGYSDITNILSVLQMYGNLVAFHGPMVCSNMRKHFDPYTKESFFRALNLGDEPIAFTNPPEEDGFHTINPGSASGMLAGGNVSLLGRACGTFYQLETAGKILFLEEVEESIPSIDMYLTQMRMAGLFENVAGILLGDFTDCTNDRYDGSYKIDEFLQDWFGKLSVPVMSHIRSGHSKPMGTLPMGTLCRMDADKKTITFEKFR